MPTSKYLSAIFFDLDGTLRHNVPPAVATFHRLAAELGVKASLEQRREAERWTYAYWADSEELRLDLEQFGSWDHNLKFWAKHTRRHLLILGAPASLALDQATIITQRMWEEYQPVDHVPTDVVPTLRDLRRAGYGLGLISNRRKPLDEVVERIGLDGSFDFTLAAGEVGWFKPDPQLLLYATSQAGVEPAKTAYVGDSYYADVICAHNAGLLPVLVDPKGLFPEADCQVIGDIGELLGLMGVTD